MIIITSNLSINILEDFVETELGQTLKGISDKSGSPSLPD